MGGLGHHPSHPYSLQALDFYIALLFPTGLLLLLLGTWLENTRRNAFRRPNGRRASARAAYSVRFASIND